MDIHTDISPVLSLIPPTMTIVAQVLPLPNKLEPSAGPGPVSFPVTAKQLPQAVVLPRQAPVAVLVTAAS